MADIAGSSSAPAKNDKLVIVRVKRKAFQSPLDGFWLEINDRPLKRPLIDFEKLSLSQSSTKVAEVKTKKVFVQHIETLSNSEVKVDVLRSFVPDALNTMDSVTKSEEKRRTFRTENKHEQLLGKAKKEHEISSKSARFEQVWRKRKGTKEANHDEALKEICHLYDVERVDVPDTTHEEKEYGNTEMEEEERLMMSSLLPLLRECVPDAATEIESEIDNYIFNGVAVGKDDYVYDLYAVKDDATMMSEDALNPFPLVQVDDNDDDFYDGPDESENESYDSNAEDNAMNEYPDEETSSDEETQSTSSDDISEEDEISVSSAEDWQPEHNEEDAFFDEGSGQDDYFDNELDGSDDSDDYKYDDDQF
ncbi:RNA-directed DNA methylation 4 [Heracleum sosnowskyi]|uniref:RNA-directed DNA methylation 4 n=1 Tax=Heracleum sosnowskyi TaxID=360622 RepID=A0AAD8IRP5_9APIA|nr:RNA-directed DNA methylation 4 [Heracleum sosnowskyi]